MDISAIAQKIRKLLALANNNPNEHERHEAMAMALELLAKHNLDMAKVEQLEDDMPDMAWVPLKYQHWIRVVFQATCKLYYTMLLLYKEDGEYKPLIIGTKDNITVTMDIACWLVACIEKEAEFFIGETVQRSFCLGAARRIEARVGEMLEAERLKKQPSTGTSLMVLRNQLEKSNQDFLEKNFIPHEQVDERPKVERTAYMLGQAYGESLNLGRQIGEKQTKQLAGD